MNAFTEKEIKFLQGLDTPAKIQDFLNKLDFNFEKSVQSGGEAETLKSPLRTLRERNAHCFEGALFGAYVLSIHGHKPLLLHLGAKKGDFDHIVAPFREDGLWGALSKTNHAVLRYREPVYKNIRELVMSYFHEYFLDNGEKTLRKYSELLDLSIFESTWPTEERDLWGIDHELNRIKHHSIVPKKMLKKLRKADKIEIRAGKIVEQKT